MFDYSIIVNKTEYSYGIVISYDKKEIIAEWLVRIEKSGKEVYLFSRQVDDNGISNIETEVSGQTEKMKPDSIFIYRILRKVFLQS